MKRILYYTTALFLFTSLLYSCKTNDKNVDNMDDVDDAMENTSVELTEEQQKMNAEYNDFKIYAMAEMDENDQNIIKLREKINKPGKTLDEARERRIEDLKAKNTELRERLNNYEANTTDWQSFKTKFNADLKDVGDTFTDIFANDSKE